MHFCQLILLLILMLKFAWNSEVPKCTEGQQLIQGIGCCSVCPVGSGMASQCRMESSPEHANATFRDTICHECGKDSGTFSSVASAISNCQQCKPCQHLERVFAECTPVSDTVCHCIDGRYRSGHSCILCSKCQHGQGRTAACTHLSNTECSECAPGTFSTWCPVTHNFVCKKCVGYCPAGYSLAENCTKMADTLCKGNADGKLYNASRLFEDSASRHLPSRPLMPDRPSNWKEVIDHGNGNLKKFRPTATVAASPDSVMMEADSNGMILLYCGLLGAVIVSLIAWILYKYTRSRAFAGKCQQHQHQHQQHQHSGSFALIPPHSPIFPPPNCQQPTPLVKLQNADSGFFSSEAITTVTNSNRMLKDISDSRFHRLENILSNSEDAQAWKSLAKELGFNDNEVTGFDTQADIVKQSPIRLMLVSWQDQDGATIGALSRALQRVGRKDALILFKESERHHHRHRAQHRGVGRKLPEESSLQEMCQV